MSQTRARGAEATDPRRDVSAAEIVFARLGRRGLVGAGLLSSLAALILCSAGGLAFDGKRARCPVAIPGINGRDGSCAIVGGGPLRARFGWWLVCSMATMRVESVQAARASRHRVAGH